MTPAAELTLYIAKKNVLGFLRTYFRLIIEGHSLAIPSGLDVPTAREAWLRYLPTISPSFSTEFVGKLAIIWARLIQLRSAEPDSDFAKQALTILHNSPEILAKPIVARAESKPAPKPYDPNAVAPAISTSYYSPLAPPTGLTRETIISRSKRAIAASDEDGFLIAYLSYVFLDTLPQVPLSTVHDTISAKWDEIIMREFGISTPSVFLLKLASRWFYIVNLKGFPLKSDQLIEFYTFFSTHRKSTPVAKLGRPSASSGSFFDSLKSLFR